jgi:hypothetical protein
VIVTQLPHIGTVSVTEMKGARTSRSSRARGACAPTPAQRSTAARRRFRAAGEAAFTAPQGVRALEPARTIGPLVLEPEPTIDPRRRSSRRPRGTAEGGQARAGANPATDAPTPPPEPTPTVEPAQAPEPAASAEPPTRARAGAATRPRPIAGPSRRRQANPPTPRVPYGYALAALLGLALVVALAIVLARRRKGASIG